MNGGKELEGSPLNWEPLTEAALLISPNGQMQENLVLLQRLIAEASSIYPQLLDLQLKLISLPTSRLETWADWLAAETVAQWRQQPVEGLSIATVVSELGLADADENKPLLVTVLGRSSDGTPISRQVVLRFLTLNEQQQLLRHKPAQLQTWLEREAAKLAEWFAPPLPESSVPSQTTLNIGFCHIQLLNNVRALRSHLLNKLRECLVGLWHAGPQAILQWLQQLIEEFQSIHNDYEAQCQESLQQESSAWRAFRTLSAPAAGNQWLLADVSSIDAEAALRALALAYNFKLEAAIYAQACQLIDELIEQTQTYASTATQADQVLANLQNSCAERCSLQPVLIPVLRDYVRDLINPSKLRRELEAWAGHSLNQWGAAESVQAEVLSEQLRLRIQPLTLEIYTECCYTALSFASGNLETKLTEVIDPPTMPLTAIPPVLERTNDLNSQ